MTLVTLAQTLHGYEQGHELLAFGGDVNEAELRLLDRMSDLPGYLPTGVSFEQYFTGFPCGRYYAFACTWPDKGARRGGTVLTHTLLMPLAQVQHLSDTQWSDLWQLHQLHRSPRFERTDDASQRKERKQFYRTPLKLELDGMRPPAPDKAKQDEALALIFTQPRRPILWMDTDGAEDVVRWLWSMLWGEIRISFAFCTLGLSLRKVNERVFDFLRVPPESQADFLELSREPIWWRKGILAESVKTQLQLPHVQAFVQAPEQVRADAMRLCEHAGLPMPASMTALPLISFYFTLRTEHAHSLSGARGRAELLQRIWSLPAHHEEWRQIFALWIEHQSQALLEPRPLWELWAMLSHPMMKAVCEAHPSLQTQRDACLQTQLLQRLSERLSLSLDALPELLAAATLAGCEAVLWQTLGLFLDRLQGGDVRAKDAQVDRQQVVTVLLPLSLEREQPEIFARCSAEVSDTRLVQLLDGWDQRLSPERRTRVLERLLQEARRQEQVRRVFWLMHRYDTASAALTGAFELALESHQLPALSTCFQSVEVSELLSWALNLPEGPGRARCWSLLLEHLRPRVETVEQLLARLGPEARVSPSSEPTSARSPSQEPLLSFLGRLGTAWGRRAVAQGLLAYPNLQELLLVRAFQASSSEPGGWEVTGLARELLNLRGAREWVDEPMLALAQTHEQSTFLRESWSVLGPGWLKRLSEAEAPVLFLGEWLRFPGLRAWLASASVEGILNGLEGPERSRLLPGALAVVQQALLALREGYQARPWWMPLVMAGVKACSREALDSSTEGLIRLLHEPMEEFTGKAFASQILERVKGLEPEKGHLLLVEVFPPLYQQVLDNRPGLLERIFTGDIIDWDKAKPMRKWLLEVWCRKQWPAEPLQKLLDKNWKLKEKFNELAEDSREGKALLK